MSQRVLAVYTYAQWCTPAIPDNCREMERDGDLTGMGNTRKFRARPSSDVLEYAPTAMRKNIFCLEQSSPESRVYILYVPRALTRNCVSLENVIEPKSILVTRINIVLRESHVYTRNVSCALAMESIEHAAHYAPL